MSGGYFPNLKGKVILNSLRVPVITGSMVYLTIELEQKTTIDNINELLKTSSQENLKGIMEFSQKELVSSDIIGNPHSCIVDSL
ncbi:MAG: type I glyceraldehyde-3-phosphate dehydrogenase, partial [Thermales bacterium]|nr:type I glyceraldehyde-3-phosphate dehydrogenase [Thermales bacterium]